MTKIALITDTHAGVRNDNVAFARHQKRFYDELFFPYLREQNIEHVIHLGDMFDRRKYIQFASLQRWREMFLDPLRDLGVSLHAIVGNHDVPYRNTLTPNSPSLLTGEYSNVTVIERPQDVEFFGIPIALVPWICDENKREVVRHVRNTRSEIMCGHLELNGFEMYAGIFMQDGGKTKWLERFDMVLSGHYHHKSSRGNIHYLGAPYDMTWHDYDDRRGFHVLDLSDRSLTFLVNPFSMYNKIWYDDSDMSAEELVEKDFSAYAGKIVKVVIVHKRNHILFDAFVKRLEDAGVHELEVVEDHLYRNLEHDDEIIDQADDTLTILGSYVDSLEVENSDDLNRLMRNLYGEAVERDDRI